MSEPHVHACMQCYGVRGCADEGDHCAVRDRSWGFLFAGDETPCAACEPHGEWDRCPDSGYEARIEVESEVGL